MQDVKLLFTNENNVQKFVKIIAALNGDFEFVSKNHILDARSLIGIFSLDLTKPLTLRIYNYNEDVKKALCKYIV